MLLDVFTVYQVNTLPVLLVAGVISAKGMQIKHYLREHSVVKASCGTAPDCLCDLYKELHLAAAGEPRQAACVTVPLAEIKLR